MSIVEVWTAGKKGEMRVASCLTGVMYAAVAEQERVLNVQTLLLKGLFVNAEAGATGARSVPNARGKRVHVL